MKNTIEERLRELGAEYEAGQRALLELDSKRAALTTTLLRIEGAMQVLNEVLEGARETNGVESVEAGSRSVNHASLAAQQQ